MSKNDQRWRNVSHRRESYTVVRLARGDSGGGGSGDLHRLELALNQPTMNIDLPNSSAPISQTRSAPVTHMVRIQIIRNIRIDSGPCTESLELALWLRHVGSEE
jgi:hypothetical protein